MNSEITAEKPVMPGTKYTQEQLIFTLEQHWLWLDSGGKEGKRAYFREADLTGCELAGLNLVQVNFRGADLRGVEMSGSVCDDADFTAVNLNDVIATGASFRRANILQVTAQRAQFSQGDFSQAQLSQGDFSQANFARSNLSEANLRESRFAQTDFSDANLFGANLRSAQMKSALFTDVLLDEADCREAQFIDTRFVRVSMIDTEFRGTAFQNAAFVETDITRAKDMDPTQQATLVKTQQQAIANSQAELEARVVEVTQNRSKLQEWVDILDSYHDEERRVQEMLVKMTSRIKYFTALWFIVVAVAAGLTALLAANIPYEKLKLVEIGLVFGVMGAILLLFIMVLATLSAASKRMHKHLMLRENKLSSWHTESMTSRPATYADSVKNQTPGNATLSSERMESRV